MPILTKYFDVAFSGIYCNNKDKCEALHYERGENICDDAYCVAYGEYLKQHQSNRYGEMVAHRCAECVTEFGV